MKFIHLSSLTLNEIIKYSIKIYETTKYLENDYPNYKKWFIEKQLKEVLEGRREILFLEENNEIIALACLKKEENKICTLYVKEEYRNKGIGTELINSVDNPNIYLWVYKNNKRAISLYEKLGFTNVEETDTRYKMKKTK